MLIKTLQRLLLIVLLLVVFTPLAYFSSYPLLKGVKETLTRSVFSAAASYLHPTPVPPDPVVDSREEPVRKAIQEAISAQSEMVLAYLLYDVQPEAVRISDDGQFAAAWLVMREVRSADPLPSEPGIAFTRLEAGEWLAVLPGDPGWLQALEDAPLEVLSEETKAEWLLMYETAAVDLPSAPLGGYLLPWAAGKTVNLSQSVSHDRYNPSGSAHFAFDFYIYRSMWEIHASKAGTVWLWKDDVPNDDNSGSGNFIVLQDTTTTPVTYQLYLHLAQNSIPSILKIRGAPVMQGQFIGVADNTGQSTGHHLHFHVHTEPRSYWGQSVDITFADVPVNGGRPRRMDNYVNELPYCLPSDVCIEGRPSYVSANIVRGDSMPPDGDITTVTTGDRVSAPSIMLAGWAVDVGSGLKSIQPVAKYDGAWREIGQAMSVSPFAYEWDLCAADVPDGPVSVAVRLVDMHGNLAPLEGLKHFIKSYSCPSPPPACVPAANQAALFSRPDYAGECKLFSIGDHSSTGSFPDDSAASLRLGSGVWVTLSAESGFRGRSETFLSGDSNLSDNRIGVNTVSSLRVKSAAALPYVPVPLWPPEEFTLNDTSSTTLVWEDFGGGLEFQARLLLGAQETLSDWHSQPYWPLGGLVVGDYTWQIRASSPAGAVSDWSAPRRLYVTALPLPAQDSLPLPYMYDAETELGWTGTGLWHRDSTPGGAYSGEASWRYGEGSGEESSYNRVRSGDLTSPPLSIPELESGSAERPYLRFRSRYETETGGSHWDQRWVQVSDGGPFQNLLQLSDDPMQFWVQSPYIDLSDYAGKDDIRIRFYFTGLDETANGYDGWYIDDIQVSMMALPACSTPTEIGSGSLAAVSLAYGDRRSGEICPAGDIDYYTFSGSAGDRIAVDIDAHSEGSSLDAVLHLLDHDRSSPLASHDDEVLGEVFDPYLGYRLPWDGDYYLKVQAWDHPGVGGAEYHYDLALFTDNVHPSAAFTFPHSNTLLPLKGTLAINAADSGSGVSHVEFFWHSADWLNTDWVSLGSDWDGGDGWSMSYSAETEQEGAAFYIRAYDWAGNSVDTGVWNLVLSRHPGIHVYLPLVAH
jgi:murein DD-endopeptidase MepM/ murein hydrolase activator NlpD